MGIKLQAAAQTAKIFAIATSIPFAIIFLFQLDAETLFNLFLCLFIAWMIWVVYQINLSQLESEEKIREIQERRETMLSNIIKD
jgi:O-antigen ligase